MNCDFDETKAGFVEGHLEAIEQFNYEAVEIIKAESADVRAEAAAMIAALMNATWKQGSSIKSGCIKWAALSAALNPLLFEGRSYKSMALELGVSKAAISKAALNIGDAFGVVFQRSRPEASREAMAKVRRGKPSNNRKAARTALQASMAQTTTDTGSPNKDG